MKIRPVGDKLFHDDELGDTTKLTVAFCDLANAPANQLLLLWNLNTSLGHFSPPICFSTSNRTYFYLFTVAARHKRMITAVTAENKVGCCSTLLMQ